MYIVVFIQNSDGIIMEFLLLIDGCMLGGVNFFPARKFVVSPGSSKSCC